MDMTLRTATPAERLYAYEQSVQIAGQCGSPGYLHRGLSQNELLVVFSEWKRDVPSLNTPEFRQAFNHIVDLLRFDDDFGFVLNTRDSMAAFCLDHPESRVGNSQEYVFRADTQDYSCLLRCLPQTDENYIYPYRRDWLDRHMEQAERGIRFISLDYKEKFKVPDGGQVRLISDDGAARDYTARYVDDCHMELVSRTGSSDLYHICELAERLERSRSKVIPMRSTLPDKCYAVLPSSDEIIIVKKGEMGYYRTDKYGHDRAAAREVVEECNESGGVSKAQAAAMLAGSMFGWDTPAADPKNYDEQGQPIKPRQRDRGEAR